MNVGLFWFFTQAWAEKAGYLRNPHSNDEIDLPVEFAGTMLGFWMARVLTKPFDQRSEKFRLHVLHRFSGVGHHRSFVYAGRRSVDGGCGQRRGPCHASGRPRLAKCQRVHVAAAAPASTGTAFASRSNVVGTQPVSQARADDRAQRHTCRTRKRLQVGLADHNDLGLGSTDRVSTYSRRHARCRRSAGARLDSGRRGVGNRTRDSGALARQARPATWLHWSFRQERRFLWRLNCSCGRNVAGGNPKEALRSLYRLPVAARPLAPARWRL